MNNAQGWTNVALYFGVFLLLFYVLVIMPRKKQEKKHNTMMDELKKGDKIVTIGGIKGEISQIRDDSIKLRIAENTDIEIVKKAVAYKVED